MNKLIALLALLGAGAFGQTYYVATNGSNSATGAIDAPWLTIQKAATVMLAGDTCLVRAGVYRETVTPARSGTALAPITYQPYQGEEVTINGAEIISAWTLDTGNVYRAAMAGNFFASPYNQSDQVFQDGQMLTLAKWPNTTTAANAYPGGVAPPVDISHPAKSVLTSASQPRVFTSIGTNWYFWVFSDTNLTPAIDNYYVGAEIYIQPANGAWSWTFSGTIVAQTNTALTLRSANSGPGSSTTLPRGSRYYLYNQRQMLDNPGEWYHDKPNGVLYLHTLDGSHPAGHVIEAKARDYAFNLNNRSYLVIRGFRLFACTITTDTASGGSNLGFDATNKVIYPWRGNNSYASANHITLDNLSATYLSHFTDVSGHFFMQWGQSSGIVVSGDDNVLMNSTLQYSAGNGVSVIGRRNKVLNNFISDMAYSPTDCAFISTGGGTQYDIEIAGNTGMRTGRSGITPRGLINAIPSNVAARIHHNDVAQCLIQDWDGGSVYTAGLDGKFVRIDHNIFHDNSNYSGVYLDFCRNYIVDHNVVWNIDRGIHLQGGTSANIVCYNNTLSVISTGFKDELGSNAGTVIQNNIICGPPGYVAIDTGFGAATIASNLLWNGVPGSATDPRFVDAVNHNYRVLSNSPARNTGLVVPAYVRDGITVPAFSDATDGQPDMGAYEHGTNWFAGARPLITVYATNTIASVGAPGVLRLRRNYAVGAVTVPLVFSGSALYGTDYTALPSNAVTFADTDDRALVQVIMTAGGTPGATVQLTLPEGGTNYCAGTPATAVVVLGIPEPALLLPLLLVLGCLESRQRRD